MQQEPKPTQSATTTVPDTGGFVKVEGGSKEQTSAEGTLIVAYLLIWAIMVFFLSRILRGQRDMQSLTQRIIIAMGSSTNDRN